MLLKIQRLDPVRFVELQLTLNQDQKRGLDTMSKTMLKALQRITEFKVNARAIPTSIRATSATRQRMRLLPPPMNRMTICLWQRAAIERTPSRRIAQSSEAQPELPPEKFGKWVHTPPGRLSQGGTGGRSCHRGAPSKMWAWVSPSHQGETTHGADAPGGHL